MKKGGRLRTDPEKAKAWQERSRDRALERARDRKQQPSMKKRRGVKRTEKPKRGKALLTRNPERQARRQDEGRVYGPFFRWVRENGACLLAGKPGHICTYGIDPHHIVTVGADGVDERNLAPLCRMAHTLSPLSVHELSTEMFERIWGVDLQAAADTLWAAYMGEGW